MTPEELRTYRKSRFEIFNFVPRISSLLDSKVLTGLMGQALPPRSTTVRNPTQK